MSFRNAPPNHIPATTNSLHRVKTERALGSGKHGRLNNVADNSAAFPSPKQLLLFSLLLFHYYRILLTNALFGLLFFLSHLSTRYHHDFNITGTVLFLSYN
ncbi:uncharacterized protein TrAtP1_004443 [Trichoderma atroviride]|uniref:uncharacterized protein n=1 Tax=Hypocrea atroviridis TaxID=63577 RepID=UPI00332C3A8C|nr:hypothetical protein TrAtP1_004443 [Trichoderma atroviride]